jgi:hypothetical protein
MEKIALCLYGHFRCFDQCWPNLYNNLIKPNNITDIFAVAWIDSFGWFQSPEQSSEHKKHPGYDSQSPVVPHDYICSVIANLKPCRIQLDNYFLHDSLFEHMVLNLSDWHHPSQNHRPKGTLSQVYGRCNSLKLAHHEELHRNFIYDRIVCTRWDIDYTTPIVLENLNPEVISMDGMYGPTVISDAWTCGPSSLMQKWSRQFSDIDRLVANKTMNLGPHEWLASHFNEFGMEWQNCPEIGIYIRR